jgi:hypothetical protein
MRDLMRVSHDELKKELQAERSNKGEMPDNGNVTIFLVPTPEPSTFPEPGSIQARLSPERAQRCHQLV